MSTRPFPCQLRLSRGESVHLHLPRGLRLVNLGASVTLAGAPRLLGGTLHEPSWRIDGGGTHLVGEGGWMRLSARGDAELALLAPAPSGWQRFASSWRWPSLRPARLATQR